MSGAAGGVRVSRRAGAEVLGKSGKEQKELRVESLPAGGRPWVLSLTLRKGEKRRGQRGQSGSSPSLVSAAARSKASFIKQRLVCRGSKRKEEADSGTFLLSQNLEGLAFPYRGSPRWEVQHCI